MTTKPWLKHYPPEVPPTIDYPDCLLQAFLEQAYRQKPEQEAIRFLGKSISYRELYQDAVALANSLVRLGVKEGTRVALMLPNSPQAVISYYAILMTGGIVVQTNPLYVERELLHQLQDSGAEIIIALDLVYPKLANIFHETKLKQIILTSIKDYLPFPKNILYSLVHSKKISKVNDKAQNISSLLSSF